MAEGQVVLESAMMRPIAPPEQLLQTVNEFYELKRKLLRDDDYQTFKVWNRDTKQLEDKKFCKKSGCQKLAFAYFISVDVVHQETVVQPDGHIVVRTWAKAIHTPSGRYFTSMASCSSKEKQKDVKDKDGHPTGEKEFFNEERLDHDVGTHSQTRASNRAILSILGSGEVSAEEFEAQDHHHAPASSKSTEKICSCKRENMKLATDGEHCESCKGKLTQAQKNLIGVKN